MNATKHVAEFDYQVAEEIVVCLEGITAFDVTSAHEIAPHELPAWTIADITAYLDRTDDERYAIRFRYRHSTLIATIPAAAIEGTA